MVVTSRSTGTPCNSQAPSASKVAAIIGKAAFLEPEAASRPWSGVPPRIMKLSKNVLAQTACHGVCAVIFTAWRVPSAIKVASGA